MKMCFFSYLQKLAKQTSLLQIMKIQVPVPLFPSDVTGLEIENFQP